MARSRNIYTSSAILRGCYQFARRERFYGDLMTPVTVKCTQVFM